MSGERCLKWRFNQFNGIDEMVFKFEIVSEMSDLVCELSLIQSKVALNESDSINIRQKCQWFASVFLSGGNKEGAP